MIRSYADGATRRFAEGAADGRGFRGLDVEAARDLLAALDAASGLGDLSPLRSVGLHKLKGAMKDRWAMTINGRWRLVFRFKDGDAHDVAILDYHKG